MFSKKMVGIIFIFIGTILIVIGTTYYFTGKEKNNDDDGMATEDYDKALKRTRNSNLKDKKCLNKVCLKGMEITDDTDLEIISADLSNDNITKIEKGKMILEFTLKNNQKIELEYDIDNLLAKGTIPFEYQSHEHKYKDAVSYEIKSIE